MFFESDYKILSNEKIAKDVYKMRLEGDTSHITAPGQFVNIKLTENFCAVLSLFATAKKMLSQLYIRWAAKALSR